VMLLCANSNIKYEVAQIFNGLPIYDGIVTIINKSDLEFEYWKTPIPLSNGGYTETWQGQFSDYDYLRRHTGNVSIQLNREEICYDVTFRVFYNSKEAIRQDYEELTTNLINKGAIIEESKILGVPIEFSHSKIDLDDNQNEATFSFSLNENIVKEELSILLQYELCDL